VFAWLSAKGSKPRLIRREWELDQCGGLIISSLPEGNPDS
jgi:hypothetical protein